MPKHEPEVLAAIRRRKPLGRVVIDDDFAGAARAGQVLCCPRCGSRFIQYGGNHDSSDGTHILFECESCRGAAEFELVITEHKGHVFVEWRESHG